MKYFMVHYILLYGGVFETVRSQFVLRSKRILAQEYIEMKLSIYLSRQNTTGVLVDVSPINEITKDQYENLTSCVRSLIVSEEPSMEIKKIV